jgi:uncharacterized protein YgiB involved in biofilm formation
VKHSKKITLTVIGAVALTALAACSDESNQSEKKAEEISVESQVKPQQNANDGSSWFMPALIGYMLGRNSTTYEEDRPSSSGATVVPNTMTTPATSIQPANTQSSQANVSRQGFGSTASAMQGAAS